MNDAPHDSTVPSVTVIGEASIRVEPDEAYLWITLAKTEPSPGLALTDVARRSELLVALLDQLEIPKQDRSTSGVTVREEFEHGKDGRRSLGHLAAATVSVRVTDMQSIGTLVMRSSDELEARITGPSWQISAAHPIRLEAASQAAANALQKASAYAAGLGLRVGRLRTLSEPADELRPRRGIIRAASAAGSQEMPIETGEQLLTASIEATFDLLEPA